MVGVGNRALMLVASSDSDKDRTVVYTYDMNDRLLTESSDADTGDDTYTVYSYGNATGTAGGDATQQTGKKVWEGLSTSGDVIESTTNAFNLQGRLAEATIVKGGDTTVLEYTYDDSGIRVTQTETVNAGTPVVHEYLVDANNPTGYQQVLEEIIDAVLAKAYTLGLDVIAQANAGTPVDDYFLLYDAHGSTRALLDALAAVAQTYAYDAYGNALGFDTAAALRNLLYSGEQFDQKLAKQYLRARYYDVATGRFNRVDPFFGDLNDPLTLHKFTYAQDNPIEGIDPTGLVTINELLIVIAKQTTLIGLRLRKLKHVTTRAYGVIVQAAIVANLLYGFTYPRLVFTMAKAAAYQREQLKRFNDIPDGQIEAKIVAKIMRIVSLAVDLYSRYQDLRRRGFDVSVKPTGFIDFSNYVHPIKGTVFIRLTESRRADERAADAARGLFPRPPGYTWHHHEVMGVMQLVKSTAHSPKLHGPRHEGGVFFWEITNNREYRR